jgi:hypothetical protein
MSDLPTDSGLPAWMRATRVEAEETPAGAGQPPPPRRLHFAVPDPEFLRQLLTQQQAAAPDGGPRDPRGTWTQPYGLRQAFRAAFAIDAIQASADPRGAPPTGAARPFAPDEVLPGAGPLLPFGRAGFLARTDAELAAGRQRLGAGQVTCPLCRGGIRDGAPCVLCDGRGFFAD